MRLDIGISLTTLSRVVVCFTKVGTHRGIRRNIRLYKIDCESEKTISSQSERVVKQTNVSDMVAFGLT